MKKYLLILTMLLTAATQLQAQTRSIQLTIAVKASTGETLTGQAVSLRHIGYDVSYGTLTLDADGQCSVKIYPGDHNLTISRDGFETLSEDFTAEEGTTEKTVAVTLKEKVQTPFALTTKSTHDAYTGSNDVLLTWNTEAPAFFDDFEDYEPFAIEFGEWTGIDGDNEVAAALLGDYPNRAVMQYAQIINPLTVVPTWWYDYPILRPYSGKQYVGFTRTNSGSANNDWLISPTVTVGTGNVLSFMGKAADRYTERFMVYVTTKTDNPQPADFTRIDLGNYEAADYKGWKEYSYDLAAYAGQPIKFAIRYISDYNSYGSFMLMVDDVYVGPRDNAVAAKALAKARRAARRSAANPYETFHVYLDGTQAGTTEDYSYLFQNLTAGLHTLGVKAVYAATESELATAQVTVEAGNYSKITFSVTTDSKLSVDGQHILLTATETGESYELAIAGGQATIASLPNGSYVVNIEEGAFSEYQQTLVVSGDATVDIALTDNILTPYNITVNAEAGDGTAVVKWNQELLFSDSFEDYDDFATGSFGDWRSYDLDQQPVYPISLQGNIIAFPGSGVATNPSAIAPMVFNPWHTTPAMLPTDVAVAAPTGDKTIIFFSPQRAQADKWLVSPLVELHDDYALTVTMKSYEVMYPESAEFAISTDGSTNPDDFTVISTAENIPSDQWTIYQTDLADYAGQTVRLGVHYKSYDTFFLQLDDFTVGPADGDTPFVDYGNIVRFDIYLDGVKVGESTTPTYTLTNLSDGEHTVGIKAIYQNGESDTATYTFNATNGVRTVSLSAQPTGQAPRYNLAGQRVDARYKGIVIQNGVKIIQK